MGSSWGSSWGISWGDSWGEIRKKTRKLRLGPWLQYKPAKQVYSLDEIRRDDEEVMQLMAVILPIIME